MMYEVYDSSCDFKHLELYLGIGIHALFLTRSHSCGLCFSWLFDPSIIVRPDDKKYPLLFTGILKLIL